MTPELKRWKEKYTGALSLFGEDFFELFGVRDAHEFITERLYADPEREESWAVIIDGEVSGCLQLIAGRGLYSGCGWLLLWLAPERRGQGCMTALLGDFCREAAARLGLRRITALTPADCTAARCVLNSCGFELDCCHPGAARREGRPLDLCIYSLSVGQ